MNLNTTSNLHAANATSVVGNSIAIPARTNAPTPATVSTSTAAAAATVASSAAVAQLGLNHVRTAFKPAIPVSAPVAAAVASAAAAVPAVVPNTAGAGALQLSGRWSLDREDSDSTNDYLEAMGLPLIARQAADKLDLMVIINQTPGEFIITRRTRIFTETKTLKFGVEVNIKNNLIKVTGDPTKITTTTQLSGFRGLLTDIRTLDDQGRMHVELQLSLPDKAPVIIHRYFRKTSESTSLENLPAFDMSLENASDVKRKR